MRSRRKKGRRLCAVKMLQSNSMGLAWDSAYQLQQRVSSVRGLCLRSVKVRTCNEFEWLGDIAAEFLGVWHLNVGHLCGMVGFGLWVQSEMCLLSQRNQATLVNPGRRSEDDGVMLWAMPR